jgi:hypothetical protein
MTAARTSRDILATAWTSNIRLYHICLLHIVLSLPFAVCHFDIDEFTFIREPYELLGGDYTVGYLKQHEYGPALTTAAKSYYFYWNYRPLFSPIVSTEDRRLFAEEERRFGYQKPNRVDLEEKKAYDKFSKRLIVPEPDRFYSHGAGKPLLPAILSIPQLALTQLFTPSDKNLLYYQYHYNYHPIFVVARISQILAGIATVWLVWWALAKEFDRRTALFGALIAAVFPTAIKFFPNIHHDSTLTPFLLASAYFFYKEKYSRAGVFFGLALASKNVAIVLVPTFIAYVAMNAWRVRSSSGVRPVSDTSRAVWQQYNGLATTLLVALVVTIPFANPISQAEEILTPITHREVDPRGENVEQFTLSGRVTDSAKADSPFAVARPEVSFFHMLLRFWDNNFFFLVIAALLFFSQARHPLARMCFIVLLCALPYGLVFGSALNYRSLLFVPFFAIVCAALAPPRYLVVLIGAMLLLDAVYCMDPITSDHSHLSVGRETLWGTLTDAFSR